MNDTPERLYQTGVNYKENKNYTLALNCFQKAAEQGHPAAQNYLGRFYQNGFGTSIDDNLAVYWYQRSAEQEYTFALHNLGFMHHHGRGVPQNHVTAARLFRRAIIQGYAGSIDHLKLMAEQTNNFTVHYYLAISNKNHKSLQPLIKQEPHDFIKILSATIPENVVDNKTRFYCLKKLMIQETRPFLARLFFNKSTKRNPDVGMEIADHQYAYLSQLLKEGNKKKIQKTLALLVKLLKTIPKNHARYAEAEFILSHVRYMQNNPSWKTHLETCQKHDPERKFIDIDSISERIVKNSLEQYQKASPEEKKQLRKTELKKIGENKYDIHALAKLSLMSPKRRSSCETSIRTINPHSSLLALNFN